VLSVLGGVVVIAVIATAANAHKGTTNPPSSNAGNSSQSTAPVSSAPPSTPAPTKASYTVAQQNAIDRANNYLQLGRGFSRVGLIQQLCSQAGDGFSHSLAVFAVDHISVNWDAQAVEAAKTYLQLGAGFSRASLIQQLTSKAGDQFTLAQARYAANHVGL
jgi:hypothetical protein